MITAQVKVDLSPLAGLRKALVGKIMRKGVRDAAAPVKDAAKNNALAFQRTGGLAKSIGIRIRTFPSAVVAIVGPKTAWRKVLGEYTRGKRKGQAKIYIPSKVAHFMRGTRRSKPRPFLDAALNTTRSIFASRLTAAIREGVMRELK